MSKVVKVQLFKGEVTYRANGTIATENAVVKLIPGTLEFEKSIETFPRFGYTSGKVLSYLDFENKDLTHARLKRDELKNDPRSKSDDINKWEQKIEQLKNAEPKEMGAAAIAEIQAKLDKVFDGPTVEAPATVDNAELKALKAQNDALTARLEALENGKAKAPEKKVAEVEANESDSELKIEEGGEDTAEEFERLSLRFEELYGKKPHHAIKSHDTLRKAIAEKEAEL